MRKLIVASICVALVLVSASAVLAWTATEGTLPGTGIKGTYHDLSSKGAAVNYGGGNWVNYGVTHDEQTTLDRICIYCHAPHHTIKPADKPGMYLPLWNHQLSTVTAYTPYTAGSSLPDGGTGHASTTTVLQSQPGAVSKLCLSCHDGTVGTNQYGFAPSQSLGKANMKIGASSRALIGGGGDLSNHHPIGFNYDTVQSVDNEIAASTTAMTATGKSIADLLYGGNMECVTCHDVHNTENTGVKFTWKDDSQSGLCLTCHLKGQGH